MALFYQRYWAHGAVLNGARPGIPPSVQLFCWTLPRLPKETVQCHDEGKDSFQGPVMRKRAVVPILVMLLAACAAPSGIPDYARTASAGDRWSVGVSYPVYSSLAACEDDPSVELAVLSADMPSSRLGFRLKAGASEADALRVADCVAPLLTSGELTITSPGD